MGVQRRLGHIIVNLAIVPAIISSSQQSYQSRSELNGEQTGLGDLNQLTESKELRASLVNRAAQLHTLQVYL